VFIIAYETLLLAISRLVTCKENGGHKWLKPQAVDLRSTFLVSCVTGNYFSALTIWSRGTTIHAHAPDRAD